MSGAAAAPSRPLADPGKQSRVAEGIPVVPAFDGFRAYAIGAIVALHLVTSSGLLAATGDGLLLRVVQGTLGQAIDALFVISGFVVFLPTVARGGRFGSVRSYALRRAARLVPAYWTIMALGIVLLAVIPVSPPLPLPGVADVALHALFLQTPTQLFSGTVPLGFGLNGVVWTLSLEVTFYLLLPLVAGWYYRRPLLGLVVAGAITAGWHEAFLHFDAVIDVLGLDLSLTDSARLQFAALSQFPFFAFSFAAGMTGAWAYVRLRASTPSPVLAPRAAGAALMALVALAGFAYLIGAGDGALIGAEAARRDPVLALGYSGSLAALMVALALAPAWLQWPFANVPVRLLADISYGVFLVHVVILTYAVRALGGEPLGGASDLAAAQGLLVIGDGTIRELMVLTAIVVPLSLLYGWGSARFLEQPIRRRAQRYGRRQERVRR